MMIDKRLELKRLLQAFCEDIKKDYPGTELTYEELDKAEVYRLISSAGKLTIELSKSEPEEDYFNAITTAWPSERRAGYEYNSSEVPFESADDEIAIIKLIFKSVIERGYKIVQKRMLLFLKNEYLVVDESDNAQIYLLRVK